MGIADPPFEELAQELSLVLMSNRNNGLPDKVPFRTEELLPSPFGMGMLCRMVMPVRGMFCCMFTQSNRLAGIVLSRLTVVRMMPPTTQQCVGQHGKQHQNACETLVHKNPYET